MIAHKEQMIFHYVWYGATLLLSFFMDWTPRLYPWAVVSCKWLSNSSEMTFLSSDASVCTFVVQVSRFMNYGRQGSMASLYLSFLPYIVYNLFAREAHVMLSILWFISVMTANMQSGAPNLPMHLGIACILYISRSIASGNRGFLTCAVCYASTTVFLHYLTVSSITSNFLLFEPLNPPVDAGKEIIGAIGLFLLSVSLFILLRFIKKYALNLLEQESDVNRLLKANVELSNELKGYGYSKYLSVNIV